MTDTTRRIEQTPFEGGPHARVIGYLFAGLGRHFKGEKVSVHLDLPLHFDPDEPEAGALPDLLVVTGIEPRPRPAYRVWEEGKPPDVIIEVTSPSTALRNRKGNRRLYQEGKVGEVFVFDPIEGLLEAFRLVTPPTYRYVKVDVGGRLRSHRLGLDLLMVADLTPAGSTFHALRLVHAGRLLLPDGQLLPEHEWVERPER